MEHLVRWFVIKGGLPRPPAELTVEAASLDGARAAAARTRLEADGFRVRSLSFGPTGLIAYVEERGP